ncbi:acetyltransferase-like isoleucine patch superfamily enzyme [Limnobacter thiooxidans]|uniref:acyltransferase n=1 Tax=Limnobacter TaxID=131079 RepID=UPI00102DCD68|nr:acyltransferase [Limnobacter sp.]MCZ8017059.1 acyltransferase [Limnobacter sp.]RZS38779.1 acetyltransferase-like isoleucine patch superfamily enzyme [Limnobacter thiooxidans]BET24767.1 hypothetical protein RGQ30_02680 [Limnobacter thiooxidans]
MWTRINRRFEQDGLFGFLVKVNRKILNKLWLFYYSSFKNVIVGRNVVIEFGVYIDSCGGKVILGNNTVLRKGAKLITYGGEIKIGNNVTVNHNTIIYGQGGVTIGDGVLIAANCILIPANHRFAADRPIRGQGSTAFGITIGEDVWLGCGVNLLDNTTIEKGVVIAAGSTVTSGCYASYCIYGGTPAKQIGSRV